MKKELLLRSITGFCFAVTILGTLMLLPPWSFVALLLLIAGSIAIKELPLLAKPNTLKFWFLLIFYLATPFALMAFMAINAAYKPFLILIFLVAFCHDTFAYLGGKLFGKHHIAPSISPNKTWEGFLSGLLATLLVLKIYPILPFSLTQWIGMSLLLTCTATLGDLFESWLKRQARVKDAGSFLPGHGGLLDRFDSIIFLSVTIFILINL
jgi:phosphatidate cytidylyltransferase